MDLFTDVKLLRFLDSNKKINHTAQFIDAELSNYGEFH